MAIPPVMVSVNDLTLRSAMDISRMQEQVAMQLNDRLSHQIEHRILEQVCLHLFGTTDVDLVRDTFEALQRDDAIRERVIAMRTARRMGVR